MDFKEICSVFHGSIPFDNYTIDLDDAEARINKFERNVSTEEGRVVLSLLQGLLSAAKGEFASSETYLMSALSKARSTRDARLISRCETYSFLLFAIKAELPLSRFHDDTGGDWRRLSDAETGDYNRRMRFIEDGFVLGPNLTELERLEREVVSKFAQYPSDIRMPAFLHHPAYHRHDGPIQDLFKSKAPFPPPILDRAERLGLIAMSRHMQRLNAEYLLAGASEQGTQELDQLYQDCLHDGDLVGAASCQLILGDNRLSLPFTSPIALNLALMNRTSARLQPWHDSLEAGYRLAYDAGADQFYERAVGLFRSAGSVRGTAAVSFRRGCVALAEYLNAAFLQSALPTPGTQAGLDAAWRASAKFQLDDALDLYHGDGTMARLVSAHRIILRTLVSCPPSTSQHPAGEAHDAVQDASDIGTWAKDNANTGVARFAGLLFLGVGRLLSTLPQNLDAASLCCACARSCFRGAEEGILELHAIIQHAKLLQSHGNMDAARTHLDEGQSALRHVIVNRLDPLIQTTESEDCRCTAKAIRASIITELDSAAASIYANDPRSLAWDTLRDGLLSQRHGPSSPTASPPSQTSPPSTFNALLSSFVDMYANYTNTSVAGTSPSTRHGAPTAGFNVAEPTVTQAAQDRTAGAAPDAANKQSDMPISITQLLGGSDAIRRIRQQYDEAIAEYRKALAVHDDWEAGQERLRVVLHALDQPGTPKSTESYSIRAAVLHHLERHDLIRQWLPDAIPAVFGGRLPTASDSFRRMFPGASPELEEMNRQIIRQHGERSLSLCFVAQDWEMGARVLRRIQGYAPGFLERMCTDKGDESWYNMVYVAAIEEHSGNLESSFRWLIKALDIIETSRSRLTDVADRRELLNVIQSAELFAGLARVSLRLSASEAPARFKFEGVTEHWAFHGPTWADEALSFLEQGRARALLDLFTPEGPSQEYLEWLHKLRKEESDMRDGKTTDTRGGDHDGDLAAYLAKLRSGLQREMESPSRAMIIERLHRAHFAADTRRLYESIPEDALAIHINPSRDGVLVLYISRRGVELARPSSFTDQRMERHVLQYLKLFKNVNMDALPSKEKCQSLLQKLSDDILSPALPLIDAKLHLIFVPSQSLNKFPFSALLLRGEPLFMQKDVSMVPSLSVLQHLVRSARPNNRQTRDASKIPNLAATVVYKAPTGGRSEPLNCSAAAAIDIARRLGCRPEQAHRLDLDAFKQAYKTSDLVLICTHGLWKPLKKMKPPNNNKVQQKPGQTPTKTPSSAWESSIELRTPLQVLELVPLRSRAALVVFQACVSGVGESSLGNDVLGFAHSVLASGAGAFVGALWNVSDVASAMLMAFLFREITAAAAGTDSSLGACLRRAQTRLYRTDASVAGKVLEEFRDACAELDDPALINPGHKRKILNTLKGVTPAEFDFSHPFFWAPFVLVGHGGQRLGDLTPQQPHASDIMSSNLPDPLSFQFGPRATPTGPLASSSQEPEEAPPPLPPRPPPLFSAPPPPPSRPPQLPPRLLPRRRPVPARGMAVSHSAASSPPQGRQVGEPLGDYPPSSLHSPGGPSGSIPSAPTYNFSPPNPSYSSPAAPSAMPAAQAVTASPQATSPESQTQPTKKRHSWFGPAVRQLAKVAFLESITPGLSTVLAYDSDNPSMPNQNQNLPPAPPPQAGIQPNAYNPGQVIVNGVALGQAELLSLQTLVGPIWPGSYWYDSLSGAYGSAGGPCTGFLPGPVLPTLGGGPLAPDASGHTGTGVFINGREIHGLDVAGLQRMGAVVVPGRWWLRADGSYGAEGSGLVLGNLRMQAAAYNAGGGGGGGGAHSWSSGGSYGGSDGQGFMYIGGPGWSWSNN
ncbi:hypothetical protein VTI74DRAFT_10377 [Chaetomium olivicolor]